MAFFGSSSLSAMVAFWEFEVEPGGSQRGLKGMESGPAASDGGTDVAR